MQDFGMSMLWFWVAYFVVTFIGILHTIFNIIVLKYSSMKEGPGMGEGYEKTKPWHPLYNIIFFSLFGWLYMRALPDPTLTEALTTGAIWVFICYQASLEPDLQAILCGISALDYFGLYSYLLGTSGWVWVDVIVN